MKIIDNRMKNTIAFSNLYPGEVFYFPSEEWYGIVLDGETDSGENAVDLETGELAMIGISAQVIKLTAQIEILQGEAEGIKNTLHPLLTKQLIPSPIRHFVQSTGPGTLARPGTSIIPQPQQFVKRKYSTKIKKLFSRNLGNFPT